MVLVLVLGDLMVPDVAAEVPLKLRSLLMPGKIHQVLCTGNLTTMESLDWLKTIAPEVYVVKGDMDEMELPASRVHTIGPLKLALIHGHQLVPWDDTETLALTARHLDVDMLLTGHSCHVDCFEFEGKMYINPGSITGAWRPGVVEASPSSATAAAATPTATNGDTAHEDDDKSAEPPHENGSEEQQQRYKGPRTTPSFVLLDVQDLHVTIYVYQLFDDEVKIVKMEYKKPAQQQQQPSAVL
ncbi:Vacuolar protein sorting-associated protein 29 [Sorochytrium milnesiophthora]